MAFLSYAHRDNDNDGNRITHLREALEKAVEIQAGQPFPIFQDRGGIPWGRAWREQVDEALDGSTFLIPILTPSFFRSEECTREAERFLDREEQLGRTNLILPIYYLRCREMEGQVPSDLATRLRTRQWVDWRQTRLHQIESDAVRRAIAALADKVTDALWHSEPVPVPASPRASAPFTPMARSAVSAVVGDDNVQVLPAGVSAEATQADSLLDEAREEADRIITRARGKAKQLVDDAKREAAKISLLAALGAGVPDFTIVLRGYDRGIVNHHIDAVRSAVERGVRRPRRPKFPLTVRGYEPSQVDEYLDRLVSHRLPKA